MHVKSMLEQKRRQSLILRYSQSVDGKSNPNAKLQLEEKTNPNAAIPDLLNDVSPKVPEKDSLQFMEFLLFHLYHGGLGIEAPV